MHRRGGEIGGMNWYRRGREGWTGRGRKEITGRGGERRGMIEKEH